MKSRFKANALLTVCIVAYVLCYAALRLTLYKGKIPLYLTFVPSVFGTVVFTAAGVVLHELGHLAAGKIQGFKVLKIGFTGFTFDFSGGKKFSFSGKREYAGLCELVPTRSGNMEKRFSMTVFGGIIGHIIIITVNIVLFAVFNAVFLRFFFLSFFLNVYFLLLNALPEINESGDGNIIKNVKKRTADGKAIINVLEITSRLYQGETPSEIDSAFFERSDGVSVFSAALLYYVYYRALDIGDPVEIKKEAEKLESVINFFGGDSYGAVAGELLYVAAVNNDFENVNKYKDAALCYCEGVNSPTSLRILASYGKFIGDAKWAELSRKTGLKLCGSYFMKGSASVEKKLLEKL